MLGLFKRRSEHENNNPAGQPTAPVLSREEIARRERLAALRRDVQVRLHESRLFPTEINVSEDGWAEVQFSPSNPRSEEAPYILRSLHRAGKLTVDGLGEANDDDTWSVRVKLNNLRSARSA